MNITCHHQSLTLLTLVCGVLSNFSHHFPCRSVCRWNGSREELNVDSLQKQTVECPGRTKGQNEW